MFDTRIWSIKEKYRLAQQEDKDLDFDEVSEFEFADVIMKITEMYGSEIEE